MSRLRQGLLRAVLGSTHLRDQLFQQVSSAPDHAHLLPLAALAWLAARPRGASLGLYGCGGLGKLLATEHAGVLRRFRVRFATTAADGEDAFHGFPKISVQGLLDDPPDFVLILSAAYAEAMLENLRGFPRQRAFTLAEALRDCGLPEGREAVVDALLARPEAAVFPWWALWDGRFPEPGAGARE